MSLTKEQEKYLADFADKGLAELADIDARNDEIALESAKQKARNEKQAQLQEQAQALIDEGMQDFEQNVLPTITAED